MADAEGHVLGNFHAYYSFNPVHERLRFMNAQACSALRRALLVPKAPAGGTAAVDVGTQAAATVIDIGCNEGDLTIGLYDALNGRAALADATRQQTDVANFDLDNISVLNERMQKAKKQVEYDIQDEGSSSHRRRFVCELQIDGQPMGHGEGVSKKVAKAKAAEVALQALDAAAAKSESKDADKPTATDKPAEDPAQRPLSEAELATRKPLLALGVDIDEVLIARAIKKPVQLASGDAVQFKHADVTTSAFQKQIAPFLELAKRADSQRKFDLVTCFSVTMWIHLNHGDDGLWRFLESVSDMTEHLIIEPQTWKCYRNALKRLTRMQVEVPKSFRELKVRADVLERIEGFLLTAGRFRYKAELGKTNWSRNVTLYSRTPIAGIAYAK